MKNKLQLSGIFIFLFWGLIPLKAQVQLVPECEIVGKGSFVSAHCFNNFSATNKKHLAVVSSSQDFDIIGGNRLKLSDDSGKTWREVRYEKSLNIDSIKFEVLQGKWISRFYSSVARPTKDLILILASERMKDDKNPSPVYGTLYPYILRSTDAGESWERIEIKDTTVTCFLNILSMADENVGYLTSGSSAHSGSSDILLYRTIDGGKTWNSISTPFPPSNVLTLQALSDKELVVSTDKGLFLSSDGGSTWEERVAVKDNIHYTFINLLKGYCTGGSKTGVGATERTTGYKTTDGGKTWNVMLDTIGTSISIGDAVSFLDESYGLIFARDNYWETRDGGKKWTLLPVPYGSGYIYNVSKAISILGEGRFFGLNASNMFFSTGRNLLAPPTINFVQMDAIQFDAQWSSIKGAKHYRVQLAKKSPEFPQLFIDYDIFDTPRKVFDTVLTGTSVHFPVFDYNTDYFARVMGIGDSLKGDWSQPIVTRTISKPPLPRLNEPTPIYPEKDVVIPTTKITFHWKKDSRAVRYSLKLSTRGNYPHAFDDSVAHNFYNITADSITVDVNPYMINSKAIFFWYVVAWAPGFDSTNSGAILFTVNKVDDVDENVYQPAEIKREITISPQPTKELMSIHGNFVTGEKIEIYSLFGEKVLESPYSPKLDVHDLPNGVYIIRIGAKSTLFSKM